MSDLRPTGVKVTICGEERHLLFTLNAIDAVQYEFDATVLEVLDAMTTADERKRPFYIKKILKILLDSEADRERLINGIELRRYTEDEIGMLIDVSNTVSVIGAIVQAFGISFPEAEGDDPNL